MLAQPRRLTAHGPADPRAGDMVAVHKALRHAQRSRLGPGRAEGLSDDGCLDLPGWAEAHAVAAVSSSPEMSARESVSARRASAAWSMRVSTARWVGPSPVSL